jgi:Spy/CpxP family protein refolding chaperone
MTSPLSSTQKVRVALLATMLMFISVAFAAQGATKVVISYASFNERTAGVLLVAKDQGFFRRQDLDAKGYELMKTLYEKRIYANTDGIRNAIRLLGVSNEKIHQLKAEDTIDERIVRKLKKEGAF